MSERNPSSPVTQFLLIAAALVIIVAGMRAAQQILVPLLVSAFLALISASPVFWLQGKRVPGPLAVFLVVLGFLGIGVGFGTLLGTSLQDFSAAIPRYQKALAEDIAHLQQWLNELGVPMPERTFLQYVDPGASMQLVANMLTGLGGILTNTFLIGLTVIFILLEASSFQKKARAAFGNPKGVSDQFGQFTTAINHYLGIKTLMSLGTGIIVTIWVWLLGIDFPMIWGLLAFLLNYVPNLGSIIAAIPAVLLAYIQYDPGRMLLVAFGYVVINVVFGNFIEPRMMGRKLGLSTLVVFLSLVFWGWLWGPVGMLLSVPMTMIVKITLESYESTQWLGILMDSESGVSRSHPP
jgi:predicted PurR-regulated permease PerM